MHGEQAKKSLENPAETGLTGGRGEGLFPVPQETEACRKCLGVLAGVHWKLVGSQRVKKTSGCLGKVIDGGGTDWLIDPPFTETEAYRKCRWVGERTFFSKRSVEAVKGAPKEKAKKSLDRRKRVGFADHLSPEKGQLFEIYFVRLIGTPNQQFNIDMGYWRKLVSQ